MKLPLEVLICIFDCLHPFDVWSLRAICRQWRSSLGSEDFEESALARLQSHHHSDAAPRETVNGSRASRLRHIRARRLGLPYSFQEVRDKFATVPQVKNVCDIALKGHHLAYLQGELHQRNVLVLRNLIRGTLSTLRGDAREKILGLALSDGYVGYATHQGFLYLTEITVGTGDDIPRIRLPSSNIISMAADGSTFVLVLETNIEGRFSVVKCNANTLQSGSFDFQAGFIADGAAVREHAFVPETMLVDASKQVIDIFSCAHVPSRDSMGSWTGPSLPVIRHTRFSFPGQMQISSDFKFERPVPLDRFATTNRFTLSELHPTGRRYEYYMAVNSAASPAHIMSTLMVLIFDTASAMMYQEKIPGLTLDPWGGSLAAIWKDRIYALRCDAGLDIYPLLETESCRQRIVCTISGKGSWKASSVLLMNESFMVKIVPQEKFLQICCFEEASTAPGYVSTGLWSVLSQPFHYQYLPHYAELAKQAGIECDSMYEYPDAETDFSEAHFVNAG